MTTTSDESKRRPISESILHNAILWDIGKCVGLTDTKENINMYADLRAKKFDQNVRNQYIQQAIEALEKMKEGPTA